MSKKLRVYTLNDLPPEVRAVTFAKCSRSPEPFDEIAQELTEEKSAEFHEKWVVGYGHSSVAEHAILSVALENVSILATKIIEDARLASYTEKSTRYQIFTRETVYYPEVIQNSEFKDDYTKVINLIFDTYEKLEKPMRQFIEKKYPQEKDQPDTLYNNICKSRTCDNIRYLLPTSTLTNLGMTANARVFEHVITKLMSSPLQEFQDIGKSIKEAAQKEVPTLVKYTETSDYLKETVTSLLEKAKQVTAEMKQVENERVRLVDYDKNGEDKIITALLYRFSNYSYKELLKKVKSMNEKEKQDLLKTSLEKRGKFDSPLREFEHALYTFDILMDYGAFRDVQRHRMCTQTNPLLTAEYGYEIPDEIVEAGFEKEYKNVTDTAAEVWQKMSEKYPNEAQYLLPLAFRKRLLVSMNLREVFYFIGLRSGKKGHISYRRIAQECWRQIKEVHPFIAEFINVEMDEEGSSWAANLTTKK